MFWGYLNLLPHLTLHYSATKGLNGHIFNRKYVQVSSLHFPSTLLTLSSPQFNKTARPAACFQNLVQANVRNKRILKEAVQSLKAEGITNYTSGFELAFDQLNQVGVSMINAPFLRDHIVFLVKDNLMLKIIILQFYNTVFEILTWKLSVCWPLQVVSVVALSPSVSAEVHNLLLSQNVWF